jgi:hypothetical protein
LTQLKLITSMRHVVFWERSAVFKLPNSILHSGTEDTTTIHCSASLQKQKSKTFLIFIGKLILNQMELFNLLYLLIKQ